MKKFRLAAFVFVTCFIFSCEENAEEAAQPTAVVPHYDESNSEKISWDDLPDNLKNAIPIEKRSESAESNRRGTTPAPIRPPRSRVRYAYSRGVWGGNGGSRFYLEPRLNGANSRIYAIGIQSGDLIDGIMTWYEDSNGTVYFAGEAGSRGGSFYLQTFNRGEYIRGIRGRSGQFLDQLTIETNSRSFSYGGRGGNPFEYRLPWNDQRHQIFAFWGRAGSFIDHLGIDIYTR